jgi:hypothetical protein
VEGGGACLKDVTFIIVQSHATDDEYGSNITALLPWGFEQCGDTGKINFNTLFTTSTTFMAAKLLRTKMKNEIVFFGRKRLCRNLFTRRYIVE